MKTYPDGCRRTLVWYVVCDCVYITGIRLRPKGQAYIHTPERHHVGHVDDETYPDGCRRTLVWYVVCDWNLPTAKGPGVYPYFIKGIYGTRY
jgi:hypothetical protein